MKPVMVWHQPTPPSIGYGAHIGRKALTAGLDVDAKSWHHDPPQQWVSQYDVFFCNLFAGSRYCTRIRELKPDAIIVAIPDGIVESVFSNRQYEANWIEQFSAADYVGAVSISTLMYGELFNKPSLWIPLYIGTPEFFADARQQEKEDFILSYDHHNFLTVQNIAALAAIQRETGLRVVYADPAPYTMAYAEAAGLKVEWVKKLPYDQYVRLAARARLGVDLYAGHGTGRNEVTLAYAGTPCIGSTYTEPYDGVVKVEPFHTSEAFDSALALLGDAAYYNEERSDGIAYAERKHGLEACVHDFDAIMTEIENPSLMEDIEPFPLEQWVPAHDLNYDEVAETEE